ncbi:MAG: hypothetical protein EBZ36_11655, partial [Acidobacteria bacterium]|nr:hypothetical protein [Acidobacteriota bacterium]
MSNKFIGSVLPGRSVVVVLSAFLAAMLFIGGVSWHGDARAVSGAIGALGVQGSEPEQEPNETAEQANQMTIPGQRTGTVRYGDAAQLEFVYANGPRDRIEDLYSFKIPEKTSVKIDVQLTFANSAADLDLILYQKGAAGKLTPLGVSNGSATTERIVPEVALETGDYLVGVTAFDNPDNTAQTSYTLLLSGGATAPVPVITGLNPISASAGSGAFSLVVNGRNFYAGQSVVRWNDQARPTTFIHSEQLVAFLTAADVASAGSASVTVVNPASLGGASSPASFQVLPAGVPEIEAEPNDGSAEATSLGVPGKRSGSVGVGDTAGLTLTTMTGHADPVEDLYAVNLMESRRLDLRLTGSNLGSDLALYLLQEKETPGQFAILGNSRLKGPVQQITTSVTLPSGRYLVGVSAVSGQSGYVIEANVPADRRLQLGPASAAPGSTISVPVTFSGQGTENQMTFSVAFDPARMSGPVFVNGPALADARVETDRSEVAHGRLGISLRLPEGQSFGIGLVEIGRLDLALAAGGQVQNSRIDFADRPVVRTLVDRSNTALIGSYEGGTLVVVPGFEADLVPRPFGSGDGRVTIADWTQTGRFIAGIDAISDGSEFQRADCAPKSTNGDGRLTVADWVLAGRYAAGLEPTAAAAGPSVLLPSANSGGQTVKVYQPHPPGSHSQVYTSEMAEQEARSIRVRPDLFSRGRENELVIELVSKGDENALGFSLVFDTSQLTYLRAATGSDASGAVINVNSSQVTQGRI